MPLFMDDPDRDDYIGDEPVFSWCPEDDIPDLTPDELRAQIEEGRADYEYERRGDL